MTDSSPVHHVLARLLPRRRHAQTQFRKKRIKSIPGKENTFKGSEARVMVCARNPIWIIVAESDLVKRALGQGQTWGIPTF